LYLLLPNITQRSKDGQNGVIYKWTLSQTRLVETSFKITVGYI
jgi:hypothetical protein